MIKKPIAVFDIDGTIIRSSLVIELTNELIARGIFPKEVAARFETAYQNWRNRHGSYEDYIAKLVEVFDEYVPGLRVDQILPAAELVMKQQQDQTYRYTRQLAAALRSTHFLLAISGSPVEMVEPFVKKYGFNAFHATVHKVKDGVYTKELELGHRQKGKILKQFIRDYNLTLTGSIGIGDTESDVEFLKLVEQPIAFNPNDKLFAEARTRGWKVVVERKNMIYTLVKGSDGSYHLDLP